MESGCHKGTCNHVADIGMQGTMDMRRRDVLKGLTASLGLAGAFRSLLLRLRLSRAQWGWWRFAGT